jgi:hypothetical protein
MSARPSLAELVLGVRIFAVAAAVPLLLRLGPARMAAIIEPRRPPRASRDDRRAEWLAARIDRVLAVGRPVVGPGCLTRGITLYYFLRRADVDVRLQFGIGEVDGSYQGHCWLVRDGEPYLERVDPRPLFTGTYSIPHRVRAARA